MIRLPPGTGRLWSSALDSSLLAILRNGKLGSGILAALAAVLTSQSRWRSALHVGMILIEKSIVVGAEAPFVNAPIRAEREAPPWDFEAAPAAKGPAAPSFRQSGAVGETTRHRPGSAQERHNIFSIKCFKQSRMATISEHLSERKMDAGGAGQRVPPVLKMKGGATFKHEIK